MKEHVCKNHYNPVLTGVVLIQAILITVSVLILFLIVKYIHDKIKQHYAQLSVIIIGAGPIGLLATLIATHNQKVNRIILFEEKSRMDLQQRPQQITFDDKSVCFLKSMGIDFDSIEGCWQNSCFTTKIGVFQEYLLDLLYTSHRPVETRFNNKFSRDHLKELDSIPERLLAIICDGPHGRSSTLLGISDEFVQHNCKAYGAVAMIERNDVTSVPTPDITVHNLTFDLHAYGNSNNNDNAAQGFHLKIFGTLRHRYISLAIQKNQSQLVRSLKVVLDQTIMRSIFQVCFNTYKGSNEPDLSDKIALRHMKFSPRLFEVKLNQRLENVAYIEDGDVFAVTEGEAARYSNFNTGYDINLSINGLSTLDHFIHLAASADADRKILSALNFKHKHHKNICQEYLKNGLQETFFQ